MEYLITSGEVYISRTLANVGPSLWDNFGSIDESISLGRHIVVE